MTLLFLKDLYRKMPPKTHFELVLEEKFDDQKFGTTFCLSSYEDLPYRFLDVLVGSKCENQMYSGFAMIFNCKFIGFIGLQ